MEGDGQSNGWDFCWEGESEPHNKRVNLFHPFPVGLWFPNCEPWKQYIGLYVALMGAAANGPVAAIVENVWESLQQRNFITQGCLLVLS